MKWRRRLHRGADALTPALQPLLQRSPALQAGWTALLDGIVALQTDRRYLRRTVFPALARHGFRKVLFVGVRGYTRGYGRWFSGAGTEFWTTDIDPEVARHGAPGRHATGDVCDIDRLLANEAFDLVVLNGIFGWGVDDPGSMDRAMRAIHAIMAPGGFLLVGWNHDRSPDPDALPSLPDLFDRAAPGGLPIRHDFADVTHVYSWYRKMPAALA